MSEQGPQWSCPWPLCISYRSSQPCQEGEGSSAVLSHAAATPRIAWFCGYCQGLSARLCLETVLQPWGWPELRDRSTMGLSEPLAGREKNLAKGSCGNVHLGSSSGNTTSGPKGRSTRARSRPAKAGRASLLCPGPSLHAACTPGQAGQITGCQS